jgi:hypothetical protein
MKTKNSKNITFWKPITNKKVKPISKLKSISIFKPMKPTYKRTASERKLIRSNPWGDRDRDLVPNWIDCKPFDRRKQGAISRKESKGMIGTEDTEKYKSISGKSMQRLLGKKHRLRSMVKESGVKINIKALDPRIGGFYNPVDNNLTLNKINKLQDNVTKTLVHELAHVRQAKEGRIRYGENSNNSVIHFLPGGEIYFPEGSQGEPISNIEILEDEAYKKGESYKEDFKSPGESPYFFPIKNTKKLSKGSELYLVVGRRFIDKSGKAKFNDPHVTHSKAIAKSIYNRVQSPTYPIEDKYTSQRTIYKIKSKKPMIIDTDIYPLEISSINNGGKEEEDYRLLPVLPRSELKKLGFKVKKRSVSIGLSELEPVTDIRKFSEEAAAEVLDLNDKDLELSYSNKKRIGPRYMNKAKKMREYEENEFNIDENHNMIPDEYEDNK